MVHDLEKRVQAAKNNVESMSQLMTKWCEAPLYERKEGKKEGLLNIEVNTLQWNRIRKAALFSARKEHRNILQDLLSHSSLTNGVISEGLFYRS